MSEKTIDMEDLINSEIQSYTTVPRKGIAARLFSQKGGARETRHQRDSVEKMELGSNDYYKEE